MTAAAVLGTPETIDAVMEALERKDPALLWVLGWSERIAQDLARVTAERDSLIKRRHEVQRAADARYSEAMHELRDWNRWKEIRQQANELLKEPGIVYQSAYVQAVVTDLMAERDRAREERDAMAGVVEAARHAANSNSQIPGGTELSYVSTYLIDELQQALARLDAARQETA